MHSLKEDYPLLLNNIAQILSSDPMLGVALLIGQNVDLELFVYYLLDEYPYYKCGEYLNNFSFNYDYNFDRNYYVTRHTDYNTIYHNSMTIDYIQIWLLNQLNKLINEYKQNI